MCIIAKLVYFLVMLQFEDNKNIRHYKPSGEFLYFIYKFEFSNKHFNNDTYILLSRFLTPKYPGYYIDYNLQSD